MRGRRSGRVWVVALLACAAAALASEAAAVTLFVRSDSQFAAAASALERRGGTIVLGRRAYGTLVIGPRSARPLVVVGRPGTRVERVLFDRTQRVKFGRVTVAPRRRDAWVTVSDSAHIDLHHLVVTAQGTNRSASVELPGSGHVRIRQSKFNHCGDRSSHWVFCIAPRETASNVVIEDNRFRDCLGCDFIHGRFGSSLTIRRNRFDRALPCRIRHERCSHQDHIELFAGSGLRVEGNRFGVFRFGGAQLNLATRLDRVRVVNNVFLGTDPRLPGFRAKRAIIVGTRANPLVPRDVRILNNTILTGAGVRRTASIRVSHWYDQVARDERPLIANNVVAVAWPRQWACLGARRWVRNVILHGAPCAASDRVGDAGLDEKGRPTAASTLLIGQANPRYAPPTDFAGRPRSGPYAPPEIGAFEYVP